jgi:hypothetical protein
MKKTDSPAPHNRRAPRFTAKVLAENGAMLSVFHAAGFPIWINMRRVASDSSSAGSCDPAKSFYECLMANVKVGAMDPVRRYYYEHLSLTEQATTMPR